MSARERPLAARRAALCSFQPVKNRLAEPNLQARRFLTATRNEAVDIVAAGSSDRQIVAFLEEVARAELTSAR